ncbi:hypothetical protein O1L55_16700 [Streptomyces albulus]|nr:hypothetical protein [Streptomyces noursei]
MAARGAPGGTAVHVVRPGGRTPWLAQAFTRTDGNDPYWRAASKGAVLDRSTVPTCLVGGWQDVFLDQSIEQYRRLRRAGCETTLLIGSWTHASALQAGWPEVFAESLAWLRARLGGEADGPRTAPVRVHVDGGAGGGTCPTGRRPGRRGGPLVPHRGRRARALGPGAAAPVGSSGTTRPTHPGRRRAGAPGRRAPRQRGPGGPAGRADVHWPELTAPSEVLGPVAARLRITATGTDGTRPTGPSTSSRACATWTRRAAR